MKRRDLLKYAALLPLTRPLLPNVSRETSASPVLGTTVPVFVWDPSDPVTAERWRKVMADRVDSAVVVPRNGANVR